MTPAGSGVASRTPNGGGRPTLEVVAARAGVSRATASRVLRGATNVSESARASVLRVADEMSYTVNRAARSLVTRRSDTVALLVAEDEDRLFHQPYFLGILRGAQSEAAAAGLQLVLAVTSTAADRQQFARYAAGGHVDGALLVSLHGDDSLPRDLENSGVPIVLNGRPLSGSNGVTSVDADNVDGARQAVELLISSGRRRIATITGPLDMSAGRDRLTGYRAALNGSRRRRKERIVEGDFTLEGGERSMAALLDREPDVDAVFAASDLTALGAIRTLRARGLRVPDDVAVIGFDDVREAQTADPPLTTVRQPIDALGRTMTRMLLARIAGEPVPTRTVLPVELVQRGSA